jgi:hypothetical protein
MSEQETQNSGQDGGVPLPDLDETAEVTHIDDAGPLAPTSGDEVSRDAAAADAAITEVVSRYVAARTAEAN